MTVSVDQQERKRVWAASLAATVILITVALLALLLVRESEHSLKPHPLTATPMPFGILDGNTQLPTFAELNANPFAFLNQHIQVTGVYRPLELEQCALRRGPEIRWALVAEDLRLNAAGLERLLSLVSPGTQLTVTGIWRHYEGWLGCGKTSVHASAWYLEAEAIVHPNPILAGGPPASSDSPSFPTKGTATAESGQPSTAVPVATQAEGSISPSPGPALPFGTPTLGAPIATSTTMPLASPTPSPGAGTTAPTHSPTPQPGTLTSTPGGTGSPTATPTPSPGSTGQPLPTATTSQTGSPTATSPPLSTATPGSGYPGPMLTVTVPPTPTTSSYP
jgi:hypothetical protein